MSLSCDTSDVVANVHKCTSGGSFFPRPPVNGAEIRQSGANNVASTGVSALSTECSP